MKKTTLKLFGEEVVIIRSAIPFASAKPDKKYWSITLTDF